MDVPYRCSTSNLTSRRDKAERSERPSFNALTMLTFLHSCIQGFVEHALICRQGLGITKKCCVSSAMCGLHCIATSTVQPKDGSYEAWKTMTIYLFVYFNATKWRRAFKKRKSGNYLKMGKNRSETDASEVPCFVAGNAQNLDGGWVPALKPWGRRAVQHE